MSDLVKYAEFLPADKQEEFKGIAQNAIIVKSREDASKYLNENQFFKSEKDAIISKTTDQYAEKFRSEKLPYLVEEEIKKRNPAKDEKDKRIEEMENTLKSMKRNELLALRKAEAVKKLSESGIPSELAELAIDEDENIFNNRITVLSGLKAWKDSQIQNHLKEKFGNTPAPKQGESDPNKTMKRSEFDNLDIDAKMKFVKNGGSLTD